MKQIALVTGSSRGIGKEIAIFLAKQGYEIILHGQKDSKSLRDTEKILKKLKSLNSVLIFDVSSFEEVEKALSKVKTIDVLINNAGISIDSTFLKMTNAEFENVLKTNLLGPFYITKQVLPKMIKKNYGRIVNISSKAADGAFGKANYSASKGALNSFTKTIALEVAKYNIKVNAVSPYFVDIGMSQKIPFKYKKKILATIASKKPGKAEDVARLCAFLVNKENNYITGEVIEVNGGLL